VAAEEVDRTISAYQAFAAEYAELRVTVPDAIQQKIWMFAHLLGDRGRVLEIGSGSGRDADALERAGLSVDRTDITPAFVELLRAKGHDARVVDPLADELAGPNQHGGYDGVWAQACLLHVDRDDLSTILARLAAVTRDQGVLYLSLKEGDGEEWSTHGAVDQPRRFVYWREQPLREVLEGSGWAVIQEIGHEHNDKGDDWLEVLANRMPLR